MLIHTCKKITLMNVFICFYDSLGAVTNPMTPAELSDLWKEAERLSARAERRSTRRQPSKYFLFFVVFSYGLFL